MKSLIIWTFLAVLLLATSSLARPEESEDCGNAEKDGEVKAWLKSARCSVKKGYEDLSESAKDFGHTVLKKVDEVKQRFSDSDEKPAGSELHVVDGPTEKIPLAPLPGGQAAPGDVKPTTE